MTGFGDWQSADAARTVELRLTVAAEEPFAGTVVVEGEPDPVTFSGWIELMGLIHDARHRPNPVPDGTDPAVAVERRQPGSVGGQQFQRSAAEADGARP